MTTFDRIFLSEVTIEAHESSAEDSSARTVKAREITWVWKDGVDLAAATSGRQRSNRIDAYWKS